MSHCKICDCQLDDPNKPESLDCGGDCLACMAEAGDPECMQAMYPILQKRVVVKITPKQAYEIMRLARVFATKRVRRFAAAKAVAGPNETIGRTIEQAKKAEKELQDFIQSLTRENE